MPRCQAPWHLPFDSVNSDFSYHFAVDRNHRQGSNDLAVSANQYRVLDVWSDDHTGTDSFEVHRTASNVSNVVGVDGEGNEMIAYEEDTDVMGSSEEVFDSGDHTDTPGDQTTLLFRNIGPLPPKSPV